MADTMNDLTTAIGRKQVAVEPDRNHAALEQIVDFKRGHREPSVCGVPTTRSR